MPLAHVLSYEAIYWQRFAYAESRDAISGIMAFCGQKTRVIHVREIGASQTSRLV